MHLVDKNTNTLFLRLWLPRAAQAKKKKDKKKKQDARDAIDPETGEHVPVATEEDSEQDEPGPGRGRGRGRRGNRGPGRQAPRRRLSQREPDSDDSWNRGTQRSRASRSGRGSQRSRGTQRGRTRGGSRGRGSQQNRGSQRVNADADDDEEDRDIHKISQKDWDAIGAEMDASRKTFPTSFGRALRNIAMYHGSFKATEFRVWQTIIGPILLNGRLPTDAYTQWSRYSRAMTMAISPEGIRISDTYDLELEMRDFVTGFEQLYYHRDKKRMRFCTSQIHGHLHLGQASRICGPLHRYMEYVMERVCLYVKRVAFSRKEPAKNVSKNVVEGERFKFLPNTTLLPPNFPEYFADSDEQGQNTGKEARLFNLTDPYKLQAPDYERYLLMTPTGKLPSFQSFDQHPPRQLYRERTNEC